MRDIDTIDIQVRTDRGEALKMYDKGYTVTEIGKALGYSEGRIRFWIDMERDRVFTKSVV